MKTISYRWLLLSAVGLCASFLMACQKDGGGGGGSVAPVNSCGANYINSQYGCIPSCGNSMGMYQNQCIAVNTGGYCSYGAQMVNGQCIPTQGTCQSGYIWSGSGCVIASTGQPYPQYYPQQGCSYCQGQPYPQPQPYPLYGGYYGYGQGGYAQPVPVYPYGYGGGFRAGFSVGFGY